MKIIQYKYFVIFFKIFYYFIFITEKVLLTIVALCSFSDKSIFSSLI